MKNKVKAIVACGLACVSILIISTWYAITFNDSRLVVPMDFASYTFQIKDLPMIISVILVCVYALVLSAALCIGIIKSNHPAKGRHITRTLNPKLGYLGFLGLLGFAGFWTYSIDESIFPFVFFLFFGFFGFYFEGKMSGTFMDERFRENAARAQLSALKVTCSIMFVTLIVLCQGRRFGNLDYILTMPKKILCRSFSSNFVLSLWFIFFRHSILYN